MRTAHAVQTPNTGARMRTSLSQQQRRLELDVPDHLARDLLPSVCGPVTFRTSKLRGVRHYRSRRIWEIPMRDFNGTESFTVFGGFYPAEAHGGNPVARQSKAG